MSEEFNPRDHDRPPREDGYTEETMLIMEHIENRGDQRIGQYLLNAVTKDERYSTMMKREDVNHMEAAENVLWEIEAPELLEAIEKMEEQHT